MALAALLDADLQEIPGNHSGPMFRPRAFAMRLREIFEEPRAAIQRHGGDPT